MVYYHGAALVSRIKADRGKAIYSSMCQAYCVTRAGTGAVGDYDGDRAADAQDGWKKAKAKGKVVLAKDIKNLNDIPAGTFAYWEGGSHGYGHVAITLGGGKIQSTDAPSWGKVGVVDIGYIAKTWKNGLKFVGYVIVEGNGHRMVDAPAPSTPKPASKGPWFTVATYNLKAPSLTTSGKHKWSLRRARQIANIKATKTDVLCLQEVGSPTDAKWYDAQLKPLGYRRVAGSKWRYIYVRNATTKFLVGGTIELSPLLDKNTKQMAWAALEVNGSYTLVGNWHLEAKDGSAADAIRVKQAAFGVTALTRTAASVQKSLGVTIGRDRWVICGDTNSQSLVAEAMVKLGFVSALTNALKSVYGAVASFNNWLAARNGKSIDYIFVDKTRPVETWSQKSDAIASDHNLLAARLGRKA